MKTLTRFYAIYMMLLGPVVLPFIILFILLLNPAGYVRGFSALGLVIVRGYKALFATLLTGVNYFDEPGRT
jgi:hypothetical protein